MYIGENYEHLEKYMQKLYANVRFLIENDGEIE